MRYLDSIKNLVPLPIKILLKYGLFAPLLDDEARRTLISIAKLRFRKRSNHPKVIFYDRFPVHFNFSKSIVVEVAQHNTVAILVGDNTHKAMITPPVHGVEVFYISRKYEIYMCLLRPRVFVTFASGLGVHSKPKNSVVIHMFHSLVSMHVVYGKESFDAYDYFFATGPHHVREFTLLKKIRQWDQKKIIKVGYLKVDELANLLKSYRRKDSRKTVLLAPSWGNYNLLRTSGPEIVRKLVKKGWKVLVRPHPHSYDYDADIIEELRSFSLNNDSCFLEGPVSDLSSMLEADIMISDWSGVAFEYAFATNRPVLFVDIKQKKYDGDNLDISLPSMEEECRKKVGIITTINRIDDDLEHLFRDRNLWHKKIIQTREEYLYNFCHSKEVASRKIIEIADGQCNE